MNKIYLLAAALLVALSAPAHAQTAPSKYLSAATTNSTLVLGRKAAVSSVVAVNTTAVIYYLKFYNKATAPICGTDVPRQTYAVLANSNFVLPTATLLQYSLGLGFCLTALYPDNDTGPAAAGVVINLGVTGQ